MRKRGTKKSKKSIDILQKILTTSSTSKKEGFVDLVEFEFDEFDLSTGSFHSEPKFKPIKKKSTYIKKSNSDLI